MHFSAKRSAHEQARRGHRYRDHLYARPALVPAMPQLPGRAAGARRGWSRAPAAPTDELDFDRRRARRGGGELGALPGRRRRRRPGRDRPGGNARWRIRRRPPAPALLPERPRPVGQRGPAEPAVHRRRALRTELVKGTFNGGTDRLPSSSRRTVAATVARSSPTWCALRRWPRERRGRAGLPRPYGRG